MTRFILVILMVLGSVTTPAVGQTARDVVWVQIEAQPGYDQALERIEDYSRILPDINGFEIGNGWFAIALGPYAPDDADVILRTYRAQGLIPGDSYIALSTTYQEQYWPAGADVLSQDIIDPAPAPTAEAPAAVAEEPGTQGAETASGAELAPDTETVAQARRSESLLSRDERRALQTALNWAGFYDADIDGAFGRGTRSSMAAWQSANGFDATGILTTRQRAVLLERYNEILDGLEMQLVTDLPAGIEIKLPTAIAAFDRYEPPFAQYNATGELPARVLLISQTGDRNTLSGLYDIMQTLEIVPLEGERSLTGNRFTLIGRNAQFVSETRAELIGSEIKGFTLIWPAGDEERRRRVLSDMQESFTRLNGVLDPAAGGADAQSIDLVAGLQIRKPLISRSGFFVDSTGAVVTTADAVDSCTRITLDDLHDATLTEVDEERGVAVLKPRETLAPPAVARFSPASPRLESEVAVAGYSFEGQLKAPSMTFGTLSDVKGLSGEMDLNRLTLNALPGDEGGPVIDNNGNVFGMLLPRPQGARQLPEEVRFALSGEAIAGVLARAGLSTYQGEQTASLDPEDITERGVGMTVLVSCWR